MNNFKDFAIVHVYPLPGDGLHETLTIVGTLEGLAALQSAIAYAIGGGTQETQILLANANPYTIHITRCDSARKWTSYPLPIPMGG
jgi:hypothetical protein